MPDGPDVEDTPLDKVLRWIVLILAALGTLAFSFLLVTELDRIADNLWEDGIVLGLLYFAFTTGGVLRSLKPNLSTRFHLASALANVLMGYVIVMFVAGIFFGWIDEGGEFVPVLMALLYLVILRAIRIREHFKPPLWTVGVVLVLTILNIVVPEILQQEARGLSVAIQLVTILVWALFLVVGFSRAQAKSAVFASDEAQADPRTFSIPLIGAMTRSPALPDTCPRCGEAATKHAMVWEFNFESSTLQTLATGLLGQLLIFLVSGSESRELLRVRICSACSGRRDSYKGMEWISRIVGIGASAVIFYSLATGAPPLIDRGLAAHLLWFGPLVVGAILALHFRTKAAEAVGVRLVGRVGDRLLLRAEKPSWTQAFTAESPR